MPRPQVISWFGPYSKPEREQILDHLTDEVPDPIHKILDEAMEDGWTSMEIGHAIAMLLERVHEHLEEQKPHGHDDDERHS